MKKIAIIGFGAASIGFLKGLQEEKKINQYNIDIYEKGENLEGAGFGGLKYDGKLFISKEMGGDLVIPLNIQKKVVEYYLTKSGLAKLDEDKKLVLSNKLEKGDSFENEELYKKFYDADFEPVRSHFFHLGTELLIETVKNIFEEFSKFNNINLIFGEEVIKVGSLPKSVGRKNET